MGPETASTSDLQNLQTISVAVPASSWRGAGEVKLPDVAISSYYWWWWWHWCRNFKVSGRVLCANGSPVVGATVCAIDVDYWWWWSSQEQVGCATTDATGSFEIDFTRCCGWWPWWWWETRDWLVDPILVDQITAFLKQNGQVGRLPRAIPSPSLAVFQPLLASAMRATRADLSKNIARANTGFVPSSSTAANISNVDPAALEGLRERLAAVLPKGFPIPIWPWYPWFPWDNCDANIIFKVTQACGGATNTIVNETVGETRWDIPTTLNVTLTASDGACCAYSCGDDCPAGNCIVPSDICQINVGSIGGNVGALPCTPAQVGLYSPGIADRPFAASVTLYGLFGDAVDVDYYEFQYATSPGGPYSPLPLPAVGGFDRWVLEFLPGPPFPNPKWVPVPFPVNTISDGTINHYVIETISHYEATNGTQIWDSSTHDLLVVLNTLNVLTNGIYYLRMVAYIASGLLGQSHLSNTDNSNPDSQAMLPVCDPNACDPVLNNWWAVAIDNRAPGDTGPSGQPMRRISTSARTTDCGHRAKSALVRDGVTTAIAHAANICVEPGDSAADRLRRLSTRTASWTFTDLRCCMGSMGTSRCCRSGSPRWRVRWLRPGRRLPPKSGPAYSQALSRGAISPVWNGGSMRLTVEATSAFPTTCAYLLRLDVYKRPIQNCDAVNDEQSNVSYGKLQCSSVARQRPVKAAREIGAALSMGGPGSSEGLRAAGARACMALPERAAALTRPTGPSRIGRRWRRWKFWIRICPRRFPQPGRVARISSPTGRTGGLDRPASLPSWRGLGGNK